MIGGGLLAGRARSPGMPACALVSGGPGRIWRLADQLGKELAVVHHRLPEVVGGYLAGHTG